MTKIQRVICAAVLMVMTGCAGPMSNVEMDYGTSYKLAIVNQTLNPEAGENLLPMAGLNGAVAQKAYDQYLKSFDKPEPAPSYLFSVGGYGATAK